MENFILGLLTSASLILAIGPQNLFVIEQGLKKNFIFIVTSICAVSDIFLIFFGVFVYSIFDSIPLELEVILNVLLLLFLINFVKNKVVDFNKSFKIEDKKKSKRFKEVIIKTLGFTYLNPHVYSDTVFILGNLSKNFSISDKLIFASGASLTSIIFFYLLGYMSSIFAKLIKKTKTWKYINLFIITFMSVIVVYVIYETFIKLTSI